MAKCTNCTRGKVTITDICPEPDCDKGRVEHTDSFGQVYTNPCSTCSGSGEVTVRVDCDICDGKGYT